MKIQRWWKINGEETLITETGREGEQKMGKTTKMDSHIKVKSLLNFMFVILILLCSQFVDYVHLDTEIPPTEEQGS